MPINANHSQFFVDLAMDGTDAYNYTVYLLNGTSNVVGSGSARARRFWTGLGWGRDGANNVFTYTAPTDNSTETAPSDPGTPIKNNVFWADDNWGVVEGIRVYYRTSATPVDVDTEPNVTHLDVDFGTLAVEGGGPAPAQYDLKTNYQITINSLEVTFT